MNLRDQLTRDKNKKLPAILPHANESPVEIAIAPPTEYDRAELRGIYNLIRQHLYAKSSEITTTPYERWCDYGFDELLKLQTVEQTRLAKRVAPIVKQITEYKIDDGIKEYIGNIDQKYRPTTMTLDATTRFNWQAGDFADNRSCYWNAHHYLEARLTAMPRAGAYALRSYNKDGNGNGRCWVVPVPWGYQNRSMTAAPLYVVTNNYGAMAGVSRASIPIGARATAAWLEHFTEGKWEYRKLDEYTHEKAYINGDCWLIYPTEGYRALPERIKMRASHFVLPEPDWVTEIRTKGYCANCRATGENLNVQAVDNGYVCENCRRRHYCQPIDRDGVFVHRDLCVNESNTWYTRRYWNEHFFFCEISRRNYPITEGVELIDGYGDSFLAHRDIALAHSEIVGGRRYLTSRPDRYSTWRRTVSIRRSTEYTGEKPVFSRLAGTVTVSALRTTILVPTNS